MPCRIWQTCVEDEICQELEALGLIESWGFAAAEPGSSDFGKIFGPDGPWQIVSTGSGRQPLWGPVQDWSNGSIYVEKVLPISGRENVAQMNISLAVLDNEAAHERAEICRLHQIRVVWASYGQSGPRAKGKHGAGWLRPVRALACTDP
ncbi:hypothetical protein GGTG_04242 [Gaeumannomyces tritici R3-111a-1]|uniref:Uncharacterized protein n=1 Tax=Gaeumannomyces tritici (strain R3-111a-1) TaxID=644352 RepID=J3NSJ1_GAET3|nr:hypothetical protein GGTG_04242 [Gaeumannomyces tritici R3-111a-1]EJT79154.1 hypothetical protein GGTG_04242 [Gaeumannomyces tritici R3-111a-1]